MSAPRTARERVRGQMRAEILAAARDHVAKEGAANLSLRSVARDLDIAPSALYRYFGGRDALLTDLILATYAALASEAERAADAAARRGGSDAERFLAVPRALRRWALARPQEWGLVFGTPVPGYQAPEETVVPYTRMAVALVRPVAEALAAGRLRGERGGSGDARSATGSLADAVAPVRDALLPGAPVGTVVRTIQAWTVILGTISLEVFGHWRRTILDPELFFDATVHDAAEAIGLG
jgi:AcrR family transcriptional regulator